MSLKNLMKRSFIKMRRLMTLPNRLSRLLETNIVLLAGLHVERIKKLDAVKDLREAEFRAFSAGGHDGIIQFLIGKIPIENRVFVEFGVQDYTESNTRFLLLNDNWSGLVIDCEQKHIDFIRNDNIYWKYDLTAVCEFVTRENINDIIKSAGITGDIGLLSIDIDGNDYWVWEAISVIDPRIVICEYNSLFGAKHSVTIPYDPEFNRTRAHYSYLYYGASLEALCGLANSKGYDFVGSTSIGTDAFFVRRDFSQPFGKLSAEDGYVESKFRESRDKNGRLSYVSGEDRKGIIEDMQVLDLDLSQVRLLRDIWSD